MRICGIVRDNGACGYYRVKSPLTALQANTDHHVSLVEPGTNEEEIRANIADSDLVVLPRPSEDRWMHIITELHHSGKKVVVEYDDNLFNVSPFSPHYVDFGTENVQVEHSGKMIPLWEDGKTIDLRANREKIDSIKRTLEMADAVQVTTDILGDAYREYNDNVLVLPNCINKNEWKGLPLKREKEETRLFWAGGSSHFEDWAQIQGVIPQLMKKYPDLKLVIMGHLFQGTLKDVDPSRIEFHPWVPTPAYPYKTAILNPDICLIPLNDSPFNACKSSIKWVEMGALGVPCVASAVSPYMEMDLGGNGLFIENNSIDGWVEGLSMLIEDKMLRWKMGGEALETVNKLYDINKRYHLWETAYKDVLNAN